MNDDSLYVCRIWSRATLPSMKTVNSR